MAKKPWYYWTFSGVQSFKFHRRGRLGGDVVEDAVDVLDLADDAAGDLVEKLPVDARPRRRHEA